jgi:hypothetical protein
MRMIKLVVTALTGLMIASSAWSAPISAPYWEFTYDLDNSSIDINSPLGLLTADLGPGAMVIQRQKPIDGAAARLASFALVYNFTVSGVITDLNVFMDGGDANGTFVPASLAIQWSTPANNWRSQGTLMCTAGALICGFAGLPENVPVPVNSIGDENIGDVAYSGTDVLMSWVLPADASGSTKTLNIVGNELAKVWIPEPTTGALVGLGLAGLALIRSRRS